MSQFRYIHSVWPAADSAATRAKQFLRDAIAGTNSVDILVSGDSNTNFGGWGWCDGLNYALQQAGSNDYATPIVPAFSRENANFYGVASKFDSYSYIDANEEPVNGAGTGSMGGALVKGTSANSAALYSLLRRTSGTMQPNASPFNYGYIASGNWADFIGGIYMVDGAGTVLPWVGQALTYRVVHAIGPGMGTIRLSGKLNIPPYTSTGNATVSCDSASYGWTTARLQIPPNSARTGVQYKFSYAESSPFNVTGPVALALQSVSRAVKGHAVQCMDHYGGATTTMVASNASGAVSVVSAYMKEARLRQINAGGTGRVVVMFQGGVNGTGSSTYAADCAAYMETCRTCWTTLGYPESDLGFIGLTSHQHNSPDTLTTIRTSAATLASTYTMVDGAALATYAQLLTGSGGTSYFANATSERQHLNEAGYKFICGNLVSALVA